MIEARLTDGGALPIHTLFGIGRNYAGHARELGNPVSDQPLVFIKPDTAVIHDGGTVLLPAASGEVQHEVELVVLLGGRGRWLPAARALEIVRGYGVGIDVTARDLQNQAKRLGQPWSIAKGFDTFAPVSDFIPATGVGDPKGLAISLAVNGQARQYGRVRDMIHSVASLIAYLSGVFTLQAGDLIFTGTPAGVGPISPGDRLEARLKLDGGADLASLTVGSRTG